MKDFYETLNRWKKEERYERWKVYRSCVTAFVIEEMTVVETKEPEADKQGSVLVVGAGGCDDLGIKFLVETGNQVTLTDIDEQSMLEAIERDSQRGVAVRPFDYLGLSDNQWLSSYETLCRLGGDFGEFAECVEGVLADAASVTWPELKQYDLVICMPIYTQLLFFYMNEIAFGAFEKAIVDQETLGGIQQLLLEGMPKVIERFNQNLLERVEADGQLIVFSDLIEDTVDGPYIEAFGDGSGVNQIVEAYVAEYGMGLGNYGLYSLDEHCTRINQQWFLWPFDEERSMIVEGVRYKRFIV